MDTVEISVEGYFDIIVSVLRSVAFVFQGSVIAGITASLAIMYFLVLMFRSAIDSKQPNPFAELILICFLGIIFVGGSSAKLTVRLVQADNLSSYAEVPGVPMLIAMPYYFANKATNLLKEETKSNFLPIELASFDEINPLQAITKLYYQNPPRTVLNGGSNSQGGYDLQKTVNNYFRQCVRVDYELNGAPPTANVTVGRKSLLDQNLFDNYQVDYNGISTDVHLTRGGPERGIKLPCPNAFALIKNELVGTAGSQWVEFNSDSGLSQNSIAKGMQLISGSLQNGSDAYDLQIGLFTARLVREGLVKSGFETEMDLMIFQGQQQRLFQKLGERSMFENITKPVITMFELLIFFLTPIYTILLALGSKGLSHIAKYFMLIIFVSLWSYMNIFIDVFTYYIVEETVNASGGFSPFSFDDIPITMSEVESAVATAASASQSVPFLLMFLMYGGVHSLMGAMRGLTDVKANGQMGAPSITSPMSNGSRDVGNLNSTKNITDGNTALSVRNANSDNFTPLSAGITTQTVGSMAVQSAQQRVEQASEAYSQSFSQLNTLLNSKTNGEMNSEGEMISANITQSDVETLSTGLQRTLGVSASDADTMALGIAAKIGTVGKDAIGGISADLRESNKKEVAESYAENKTAVDQLVAQFAATTGYSDVSASQLNYSESDQKAVQDQLSRVQQSAAQLSEAKSNSETISNTVAQSGNISSSASLNLAPYTNLENFNGHNVLEPMKIRENLDKYGNPVDNKEFMQYLTATYKTTDFAEIKDQKVAFDQNIMSMMNTDGKGTDAGVMGSIMSGFHASIMKPNGVSSNEQIEERLEALRIGAEAIAAQGSEDLGNQANMFASVIRTQEAQFEDLKGNQGKADSTINRNDIIADNTNKDVVEAKVGQEFEPSTSGVKNPTDQATIAGLQGEAGGVQALVSENEETQERIRRDGEELYEKADATTGATAALMDFARQVFGDGVQDFEYGSAQVKMQDFVKNHNSEELENAIKEGRAPEFIDSTMYEALDQTIERITSGDTDFTDAKGGDLVKSYMAIDSITANKDAMIGKGVSADYINRLEGVKKKMDDIFNPNAEANKSDKESNFAFKDNDTYELFKGISSQVAGNKMEVSSGLAMFSQATDKDAFEGGSFWDKVTGDNAMLISEASRFNGSNANSAYDIRENSQAVKEHLNGKGINSFDERLDQYTNSAPNSGNSVFGMVDYVDRNEQSLLAGNMAVGAANLAYSQGMIAGEDSVNLGTESAGANDAILRGQSGYERTLSAYQAALDNKEGDLANWQSGNGDDNRNKMYENNNQALQDVVNAYQGKDADNIRENLRAESESLIIYGGSVSESSLKFSPDNMASGGFVNNIETARGGASFIGEYDSGNGTQGVYKDNNSDVLFYQEKGTVDAEGNRSGFSSISEAKGGDIRRASDIQSNEKFTSVQDLDRPERLANMSDAIYQQNGVDIGETKRSSGEDIQMEENKSTGFNEISDSMIGNDGKLMLTTGNFSDAGRRIVDNEDIGQLFEDKGTNQFMSVEYGKMRYYNENPNNL